MEGSKNYIKFMRQLEIICFYRNIYDLNYEQIAYILNSHSDVIECYYLYLLESSHVKAYLKEDIQEV